MLATIRRALHRLSQTRRSILEMSAAPRNRTERVFFANACAMALLFFLALLFEHPPTARMIIILFLLLLLLIAILLFLAIALARLLLFLRLAIFFDLPFDESLSLRVIDAILASSLLALLANIPHALRIGRLQIARQLFGGRRARLRILKKAIDVRLLGVVALLGLSVGGSMPEPGEQRAIRHRGALDEPAERLRVFRRPTLKRLFRDFAVFPLRALPDVDPELSEQRSEPSWDSGLHRNADPRIRTPLRSRQAAPAVLAAKA